MPMPPMALITPNNTMKAQPHHQFRWSCVYTALFHAFHKLLHILIHSYLKGMIGKIINLRKWDVIDAGQLGFGTTFIIHKEFIVPRQT